ncbi:hypothetical protein [Dryocola clanedunensis]
MLFNKTALLYLSILLISGCQSMQPAADDRYFVEFESAPQESMMSQVDHFIMQKNSTEVKNLEVLYGKNRTADSKVLAGLVEKYYGVTARTLLISDDDNKLYLSMQYTNPGKDDCYIFELDDINWYKSTSEELAQYIQREVCATNMNDQFSRAN